MKKMMFSQAANNLGKYMSQAIKWADHPERKLPFSNMRYKYGDLEIVLNDPLDKSMYSLLEKGKEVGSFDTWPEKWKKPL